MSGREKTGRKVGPGRIIERVERMARHVRIQSTCTELNEDHMRILNFEMSGMKMKNRNGKKGNTGASFAFVTKRTCITIKTTKKLKKDMLSA